jgi:hypothetical protein
MSKSSKAKVEQADGQSRRRNGGHQFLKRHKRRLERHKANRDPEAIPTYKRFAGYEM